MLYGDISSRLSGATVLEDFEGTTMSSYSGQTGNFSVQSTTTIEGSETLEGTGTFSNIGKDGVTVARGNEYKCRGQYDASDAEMHWLLHVQDTANPYQDCYLCWADVGNNELELIRRTGGSSSSLGTASVTFSTNTEYRLAFESRANQMDTVAYDASDTELGRVSTSETDSEKHTGGSFGFRTGGTLTPYYDYVTETSL